MSRRIVSRKSSLNSRQVAMAHLKTEIFGGPDMTGAVCATIDPDAYFPERGTIIPPVARNACIGCPVRLNCLLLAVEGPRVEAGYWGGRTVKQLRALQMEPVQGCELPPGWLVVNDHAVRPRVA